MVIKNAELCWTKGDRSYRQGIKGRKNYFHYASEGKYNGYGGCHMNIPMELELCGYDENGRLVSIDVRSYLLESIGRKRMSNSLFKDLQQCIPAEIIVDDNTKHLTQESLSQICVAYNALR